MDWDKVKKQRSAEAKVKMPDTSNSNPWKCKLERP